MEKRKKDKGGAFPEGKGKGKVLGGTPDLSALKKKRKGRETGREEKEERACNTFAGTSHFSFYNGVSGSGEKGGKGKKKKGGEHDFCNGLSPAFPAGEAWQKKKKKRGGKTC